MARQQAAALTSSATRSTSTTNTLDVAALAQGQAPAPASTNPTQYEVADVQTVDQQATTERLLREQNPVEAGAHDIAVQFANFMKIIGASS